MELCGYEAIKRKKNLLRTAEWQQVNLPTKSQHAANMMLISSQ